MAHRSENEFHSPYSDRTYSPGIHTYGGGTTSSNSIQDHSHDLSQNMQSSHSYPFSAQDARSSYPSFLSLPETIALQLSWAWRGLVDASRWDVVLSITLR